jgi:5-methylcytosine-specific restriction endonuclease McrA
LVGATWESMVDALLPSECVYCGQEAEVLDHIRPRSKGGMDHDGNLVPSCKKCNNGRGGKHRRTLVEWDRDRVTRAASVSSKVMAELERLGAVV